MTSPAFAKLSADRDDHLVRDSGGPMEVNPRELNELLIEYERLVGLVREAYYEGCEDPRSGVWEDSDARYDLDKILNP